MKRQMIRKNIAIEVYERYFTDSNVEITQRVREGQTFLFTGSGSKNEADKKARSIRSYAYEAFIYNKDRERIPAGHAVPK